MQQGRIGSGSEALCWNACWWVPGRLEALTGLCIGRGALKQLAISAHSDDACQYTPHVLPRRRLSLTLGSLRRS